MSYKKLLEPTNNDHQVMVRPPDQLMTEEPHKVTVSSAGQGQEIQKDIKDRNMVKDKSP